MIGALGALAAWLVFRDSGLASDPAPAPLWVWLGLTVGAIVLVVLGWSSARWWRRVLTVLVVPLCGLCLALTLNQWVGYLTTVPEAWAVITAGPLPQQVDLDQLAGLRGTVPSSGRVVPVDIPARASGFAHRTEDVYLPPAWFAGPRPPCR